MKTQEKNKTINIFKGKWDGVPATVRKTLFETSLYESLFTSLFWHIALIILIWLITFVFFFFGITPKLFPKPKQNVRDIEFIMKNSHISRVKYSQAKTQHSSAAKASIEPKKEPEKINTKVPSVKNVVSKKSETHTSKSTKLAKTTKSTGQTKTTVARHSQGVPVPAFSMSMSKIKSMSSGLDGSGSSKRHGSGLASSNSSSGINNAFSSGNGSSGHSGFDKNATKKVITTYNIAPYVNELKRNIRWNWKTPKSNKRVELFLRIAKDGRLVILNVKHTSEVGEVDNAALNAVRKCLPLNPLPSKYSKSYLDVIFTFDSNSIGSRY